MRYKGAQRCSCGLLEVKDLEIWRWKLANHLAPVKVSSHCCQNRLLAVKAAIFILHYSDPKLSASGNDVHVHTAVQISQNCNFQYFDLVQYLS